MKLKMISVSEIQPNPFQPRERFEKDSLKELTESIEEAGILQPVVVREHGFNFQIVAGERRWRAAQMAGLKKIPCIIKEVVEERVLFESLIENLHRRDLTDTERENAVHEIWANRDDFAIKTKTELARRLGISEHKVSDDIDSWEFRHKQKIPLGVSTDVIRRTRGLKPKTRKRLIVKVDKGQIKASEVDTTARVIRSGSDILKRELLKPKPTITPKMAETIMTRLPTEEEQRQIIDEIRRFKLTEEEVEDKVRGIKYGKKIEPSTKKSEDEQPTVFTVQQYDCPYCKTHYVIRCDGKHDWIEQELTESKS